MFIQLNCKPKYIFVGNLIANVLHLLLIYGNVLAINVNIANILTLDIFIKC